MRNPEFQVRAGITAGLFIATAGLSTYEEK
jgi:hypothetical protein